MRPTKFGRSVDIFIAGKPETQGSMKGFVINGRAVLTSTNKNLKTWRAAIAAECPRLEGGPFDGAVMVMVDFCFERPKSHFKKNGELRPDAPPYPHKMRCDLDKLQRAVGDALTGILWTDDCRIVQWNAVKFYCPGPYMIPGAYIHVSEVLMESSFK